MMSASPMALPDSTVVMGDPSAFGESDINALSQTT